MKLSGLIITKNNTRTISDCVKSLAPLLSELIIIDDFSADDTLELIKKEYPGAQIHKQRLDRFDEQRNYGISLAKNPWILMIDSDEIISPELAASIKSLAEQEQTDAYWVTRLNRFFSVYLTEKSTERPILFRQTLRFSYPVHEIIILPEERKKQLNGCLFHETWTSIEHNMAKMNAYSGLIAQKWLEQGRNYGPLTLTALALLLPIRYFFICFFGKKFYKAGLFNGIFYALFESSWWLAVIFKYREARQKNKR